MTRVGIVDLGIGNMGSILGAVAALGFDPEPVRRPEEAGGHDRLLLPGVGSFADGMAAIDAAGLGEPLRAHARAGKPLLGICLGMQLLFESGEEGGERAGLGILAGRIVRMKSPPPARWPHVGWNGLSIARPHELLTGLRTGADFYFVHGYQADSAESQIVAYAENGGKFPAVVARGSTFGVQFHAEKSQRSGLRIIENFCRWRGTC